MLDEDLARLYGVATGQLNQARKRNQRRFPRDFAFQLTSAECRNLKSQIVISSGVHGGRRSRPWVFTEHGATMAAALLNSTRAIDMSVLVVRAFLRLRMLTAGHRELAAQLNLLERRVNVHDEELNTVIATLRKLIQTPPRARRAIGFSSGTVTPPTVVPAAVRRRLKG